MKIGAFKITPFWLGVGIQKNDQPYFFGRVRFHAVRFQETR